MSGAGGAEGWEDLDIAVRPRKTGKHPWTAGHLGDLVRLSVSLTVIGSAGGGQPKNMERTSSRAFERTVATIPFNVTLQVET